MHDPCDKPFQLAPCNDHDLDIDLLQGQSCCQTGYHNSPNLLVSCNIQGEMKTNMLSELCFRRVVFITLWNAYPSGHLVPSPILGLANDPIVETKFLELAMSLLDFSPRIPLGTFSILIHTVFHCFLGHSQDHH